ncbi:MAG: T9SS type A sorting domain-containing protein [Saprospiraceae bacterium]
MKPTLLGFCLISLFQILAYGANAQCGVFTYNSSTLNLISSSGGNCTYTFSANFNISGGNPSLQFAYRCGTSGSFTDLNCEGGFNIGVNSRTSTNFICPCNQIAYGQYSGWSSTKCSGNNCGGSNSTINLAIDLKEFSIVSTERNDCYFWSIEDPQLNSLFVIETGNNETEFNPIKQILTKTNLDLKYSYKECLPKTNHSFARLKIIKPDGLILYSNILKLKNSSNMKVIAYRINNYVKVLGVEEVINAKYELFDVYGRMIRKDQLQNGSIESQQEPGIYFLKISGENLKPTTVKFVY